MSVKTTEQEIPVTLYVNARPPIFGDEVKMGYRISIDTDNITKYIDDAIHLSKHEITITVPGGVDVLTGMVDGLKEKQKSIRAKAELECNQIETQIQSMLCIEHQPGEGNQ